MSNICMDTVVFYAASDEQESGLSALRQAVSACYPDRTSVNDSGLCRIFEQNNIPMDGLNLRSDVVDTSLVEDGHITLYCDSAWNPMYEAYLCLADHFNVSFELRAEESECGIYINTDINGFYLPTQYKAYLSERPQDGSLDTLFDNTGGIRTFTLIRRMTCSSGLRSAAALPQTPPRHCGAFWMQIMFPSINL